MYAMVGLNGTNFQLLADKFNFSKYHTVADIGGALGAFAVEVAKKHKDIKVYTCDLEPVKEWAQEYVDEHNLGDRVEVKVLDFNKDEFPKVDVITMGNILHDWDLEIKKMLLTKAYEALPEGGAFIAIENVIDEDRRVRTDGFLMSLNMLVETPGGFDYSEGDFKEWVKEIGFKSTEFISLAGNTAAIAYK